ncbi:MAG: DNA polymerase III subunit gamma/tau [Lachnospiraceae bacterium]|nr:DNA polymerase III subunit gamma/tau [Lachnospiraceae bacterium]
MSYTALYRKFRPNEFSEVKGQEHIVTTLKNQINADRIGHAYLFCGTRGTGKTTIAKIFAKAVNCEHPVDGNPCNECETCKAINSGASMNVMEIDAASNNGVDNIREIREEVQYSPTKGRFKVYIIDEVHMLSIGAFNALLKTLEEPPSYVIFILATTEAHKLPVTILSRCQRYDFKRITVDTIEARLKELVERENVQAEDKALRYIAKMADGALRDGLSLLDQCISFYLGQELTYENVLEVLGAVDTEVFSKLLRYIMAGDTMSCINTLEEMIVLGRDLTQFVTDFTWYLRNLMLVKASDNMDDMMEMSAERIIALKEEASKVELETIMRYIRILSDLLNQIKYAKSKRVLVEVALIKMTRPAMENDFGSYVGRIEQLEKQLENGVVMSAPISNQEAIQNAASIEQEQTVKYDDAASDEVKDIVDNWIAIVNGLEPPLNKYLRGTVAVGSGGNSVTIKFKDDFTFAAVSRDGTSDNLEKLLTERIKKNVKVQLKQLTENAGNTDVLDAVKAVIKMDIIEE